MESTSIWSSAGNGKNQLTARMAGNGHGHSPLLRSGKETVPNFIAHTPRSAADIAKAELEPKEPEQKKTRHRRAKRKSERRRQIDKLSPRYQDLADGRISIEDLDTEELTRGQLRNVDGTFSGPKPAVIPRAFHDVLQKELQKRMQLMFNGQLMVGFNAIVDIAQDERAAVTRERLAAAQYIVERGIGKIAEKQEISGEVTVFEKQISTGGFLMDLGEIEQGE